MPSQDRKHVALIPPKPPPPIVGKVSHYSVELCWDEALDRLNEMTRKGDGRIRVVLQEQKGDTWETLYTGYGKRHVVDGLHPLTKYYYRICFKSDDGESAPSEVTHIVTNKEPLTSEHLHRAVNRRDINEIVRVLDSGDVNIDCPDKYSLTPLMNAAKKGFLDVCKLLAERGATIDEQNENLKTALMLACFSGKSDCVEFLREKGASYESRDKSGSQPIHYATDGSSLEVIKLILEDGADVNSTDTTSKWTPLLRCASVTGNPDVANLLIRKGAEINCRDKDGKTALMIAVVNGQLPLVELLLSCNADVTIQNSFGKTAYDMAQTMDRERIHQVLEEHLQKNQIMTN